MEPEFPISCLGLDSSLGPVTPNLGCLAKSAECTVHFLGHGLSIDDETHVGKG